MPEQDIPERDDPLDQGAEAVMPPNSGADDTPSESATAPVSSSCHGGGRGGRWPASHTSPVPREDDSLLDENEVVGV